MISCKKISKSMIYLLIGYILSLLIWIIVFGEYKEGVLYYCILVTSSLIGIGSILSCMVSIDINEKYFYKYIALTFAVISVFNIVFVIIDMFNLYESNTLNKEIQLIAFSMGFEIISLFVSFKYLNKKLNAEKFLISRICIVLAILILVLKTDIIPVMYDLDNRYTFVCYILRAIYIISYLYIIKLIKDNKKAMYSNTSEILMKYIILRVLTFIFIILFDCFYALNLNVNKNIINAIISIIRFFISYYMLQISIIYGIKMPNIKLYEELLKEQEIAKNRNDVLSNISHEFKTPVNVIYSAVQMQDLNIKNNNIDNMKEFNAIVKQNCNRLVRLINNFIDSTKFENRNFIVNFKCVNIVNIVEEITMSVLPFAQNKNIELVFDTCEEELFCYIDIEFLERIVLNILSNSIKYNKENGSIVVEIKEENQNIIISISDTGIGIPKDKMDKLFNRFDRIDRSLSRHKEGTGIGLNIVKQMVDNLNGTINIDSVENNGTTVEIKFKKASEKFQDKYNYYNDITQKVELELSDI